MRCYPAWLGLPSAMRSVARCGAQPAPLPAAPRRPAAGALLSAGERLSADTIAKLGQALRAVIDSAGDDEEVRAAAAGATGAFARHCTPDDLRGALETGPLAAGSGKLSERIGSAQVRGLGRGRREGEGRRPYCGGSWGVRARPLLHGSKRFSFRVGNGGWVGQAQRSVHTVCQASTEAWNPPERAPHPATPSPAQTDCGGCSAACSGAA